MKNKTCVYFIAVVATLLMVASSIQAGPMSITNQANPQTTTISYHFSVSQTEQNNGYVTVHLPEATNSRNVPGEPILPVVMKTLEFPLGTRITDISCTPGAITTRLLAEKVAPAVAPVIDASVVRTQQQRPDATIYTSNQLYPAEWYSYKLTGGLNRDNILTTFLTIEINPVRYNPVEDTLQSLSDLSLTVTSEKPAHAFTPLTTTYDLVIIAYDAYAPLLRQLVNHKISHGVQTKLVTMSDIKKGTDFPAQGKTTQEKIKYFIKNAKETWNVTYVMLMGNYWQVPVQYSYLETDKGQRYEELKFATDLYYADLYDGAGNFLTWDTNDNGKCAEWPWNHGRTDVVDLVPDVHVGRLACMTKGEVRTAVKKIITYENTTAGAGWFNKIIGIGGDTFPPSDEGGTNFPEGEVCTEKAMEILNDFIGVKLWMSLGTLTTDSIIQETNKGCGVLYFSGHGNPRSWATHLMGDYVNWTGKFQNKDMYKLKNKDMYPIMIVGGCHNSEVDVTPMRFIQGLLSQGRNYFTFNDTWLGSYYLYNWVPQCWSWVLVSVPNGAIGSIGSVGFGCVTTGDYDHNGIPDCIEGADGWFETQFLKLYHDDHINHLGQTYDLAVGNYAHTFPVNTSYYDAKVLETHILFGDPSLMIGGYE